MKCIVVKFFDSSFKKLSYQEQTLSLVKQFIDSSELAVKVLEIGPGDYWLFNSLSSDYKKKIEYSVMDISASTNDANIRLIRANLEEFIYKKSSFSEDEKFDIIICNEVIEHFDFPVGFVSFLRDLCDEGSCLVLSTPNIYNIGNLISNVRGMDGHGKIANSVVTRKNFFRYSHVTHYSEASLFDILNSFFRDVRVSQCGTINSLPRLLVDAIFWVFPRHRPSLLAIAKFPRFEKSGAAVVDCPKNGYVVPLMDEMCLHKEPDNAICRACRFAE